MSAISNVFRLTWSIESFHIDALDGYIALESGFFKVESLKNTRWNLRLFREGIGKEDWIMCDLKNGCSLPESETIYLNCNLYIKATNEKYFERVGIYIESKPASFYRTPFVPTHRLKDKHHPNNTLTVVCEIGPYGETRDTDDLERLSNDASSLYLNMPYADLILSTDDHQVFNAHKFVLCSRWNESNSWLNSAQYMVKVEGVSGPVFEKFLRYLYTGKLRGNHVCQELADFASEKCLDLIRGMRTLSTEMTMLTPMNTQRTVLKWRVEDFFSSGPNALPQYQVISLSYHLYTPELMVGLDQAVDDSTGDLYLDISFWFTLFEPGQNVFLRCNVTLLGESIESGEDMSETHVFCKEDEWHFPPRIKMDRLAQLSNSQLVLTLDIGGYHSSPVVVTTRTTFRTESRDVKNLRELARNFKDVVKESRYYDLIVETERNSLYLHRAMLSIRSNLFRKILKRRNTSEGIQTVNISPIPFELMRHFVEFIYCGSLSYLSLGQVNTLMGLSEEFHMPKLEEFCTTFMNYYSRRLQMWT